ncbi:hypothetical protein [Actinomadura rubrisoli]|uniref:Uncharacterized protein n=1 Tax=Actinomadura rubrisoli TaxID=2530368 RepID=A0A4R5CC74_9ACTN|nr:hypothetical protein [Actinomadura rubrisoli]TDD96459.1 hypothetical protein E1298_03195 [Actinomadura rubrisoli]
MPVSTDPDQLRVPLWRRSLGGIFVLFLLLASVGFVVSAAHPPHLWIVLAAVFVVGSAGIVAASRRLRKAVSRRAGDRT